MRMLMHVHLPLEPFNTAVRDGSAGQKVKRILERGQARSRVFLRAQRPTRRNPGR